MPSLTPEQLLREIASGELRPVYYLGGEEAFRKNEAVKKIKEKINPDDFNYFASDCDKTSAAEIVSLAQTSPVFSDKRLIVLRHAEKLRAEGRETLSEYLANPLDSTCLVLSADEKKKDDAFVKICAETGAKVIFSGLKSGETEAWIQERLSAKGMRATPEAAKLLAESAGTDLHALEREIAKLLIYLSGEKDKTVAEGHVLESLGFSREENPFDLGNALVDRDAKRAAELIDRLIAGGEEPIFILSVISRTLLKLAKVKMLSESGVERERIFQAAGLHPYYGGAFLRSAAAFPDADALLQTLKKALECEALLKSSAVNAPAAMLKGLVLKAAAAKPRKI